jgi:hypothetical protein
MRIIQLAKSGSFAVVDDEDYEALKDYRWWLHKDPSHPIGYAQGQRKRGEKIVYMHRLISEAVEGMVVDHRNMNSLDNRRCNLRVASHSESQHNKLAYRNNKSGYKGVFRDSFTGKWTTSINLNGKTVFRKRCNSLEDAAQIYALMSYIYHGEFSNTGG